MFSAPPASATATSPSRIEREAMLTAAIEEQQALSTVYATRSVGMPSSISSWRAMDRSAQGKLTPVATSSTSSGVIPALRMASAATRPPSFGSVKSFNAPPNFPKGLRTALMTATSSRLTDTSPSLDDPFRLQPADLCLCITQHFRKDFRVVLSQERRRAGQRLGAAGQLGDRADQLDRAEDGIGHVDHEPPGCDMRVVENLLGGLDGADWQSNCQQLRRSAGFCLVAEPAADDLPEPTRHVLCSFRTRVSAIVTHQVGPLDGR